MDCRLEVIEAMIFQVSFQVLSDMNRGDAGTLGGHPPSSFRDGVLGVHSAKFVVNSLISLEPGHLYAKSNPSHETTTTTTRSGRIAV